MDERTPNNIVGRVHSGAASSGPRLAGDDVNVLLVTGGGRSYGDQKKTVDTELDALNVAYKFELLVHGGASGADTLADKWARSRGVHVAVINALWDKYWRAAGSMRNEIMALVKPTVCVAFPGNSGTADMVKRCKKYTIPVIKIDEVLQ